MINVRADEPVRSPDDFLMLPFVMEAIDDLYRNEYRVIVLADNSLVRKGEMQESDLAAIHDRMKSFFGNAAGIVDVLPCPETEVKGELCFPNPVLLSACAKKYGFDHRQVFYIGSRIEALRSAWAAGTRSALVRTGKPFRTLQILRNSTQQPDVLQNDLLSTVIRIRSME